jgi:hypothetical protein
MQTDNFNLDEAIENDSEFQRILEEELKRRQQKSQSNGLALTKLRDLLNEPEEQVD